MKTLKEIDKEWRSALKELEEARLEYEKLMADSLALMNKQALSSSGKRELVEGKRSKTNAELGKIKSDANKKEKAEKIFLHEMTMALDSIKQKMGGVENKLARIRKEFYQTLPKEPALQVSPFQEMDKCRIASENSIIPEVEDLTFMEIISIPIEIDNISQDEAKKALKNASVDYRGWPYIFFLEDSRVPPQYFDNRISAVNNEPFFGRPTYDYWAFYYDSRIFYSRNLSVLSQFREPDKFSYFDEAKIIGEVIISIGRLYNSLGVSLDSGVIIAIRYSPTKKIIAVDGTMFKRQYSKPFSDDVLTYKVIRPLSDCLNKPAHVASAIIFNLLSKLGYWGGYGHDGFISEIEKHLKITEAK